MRSRISDSLSSLETKIEALVRSRIHRGTVHVSVSLRRAPGEEIPNINTDALLSYLQELRQLRDGNQDVVGEVDLALLLTLPGVLSSTKESRRDDRELWSFVESVVTKAIDNLDQMRAIEGHRMAETLEEDCRQASERLALIEQMAPRAVDVYRNRLQTKIERVLQEHDLQVQTVELLREVQVYADRVDISEEDHATGKPSGDVHQRPEGGRSTGADGPQSSTSSCRRCSAKPIPSVARRPMRRSRPMSLRSNVRLNECENSSRILNRQVATKTVRSEG